MSFIQQFFTSRDNNANAETFVGQEGRLWWDPITNQIYSSDGNTPGGIPLAGGGGGNGTPGGSNSQVQFNNSGTFGGSANLTFNRVNGALTAVSFAGDGSTLSNIAGANVVGEVTNATYASSAVNAITAETVTASEQPNITGVGTLSVLSVSGNVTGNYFIGNGSQLTGISGGLPLANGTSNFDIATANGAATITVNGTRTWTFDTAGALSLAGNVVTTANLIIKADNNNAWISQAAGDGGFSQLFWTSDIANADPYDGNGDWAWAYVDSGGFNIATNVVEPTENYNWQFNTDGVFESPGKFVTTPGNTSAVFDFHAPGVGDGSSDLEFGTDGLGIQYFVASVNDPSGQAMTFELTAVDEGNIEAQIRAQRGPDTFTWTFNGNGDLILPGNSAYIGSQSSQVDIYSDINTETAGITIQSSFSTHIFNEAVVDITTNAGDVPHQWQFDQTGNLTIPGSITRSGYNNPELLIANADSNWAYGFSSDNVANYYAQVKFYGDNSATRGFKILDVNSSNAWVFDGQGIVTLPGEGVIRSINDTVTLQSLNTTTGNANSVYLGSSGGLGFNDQAIGGNWLEIFRNGAEPEIRVPVGRGNLTIQTAEGENSYNWTFGKDGTTTFPNNIINAGSNPITLWSTDSSAVLWRSPTGGGPGQPFQSTLNANNGNATIELITGTAGVGSISTWTFNTGNVVFPDATVQTTAFTGTATSATTAGTVTSNAQANITSVGTLTSLSVSGNIVSGNVRTGGQVSATGNITGGNVLSNGQLSTAGNIIAGNISIGGNLSTPGNIGASFVNGAYYTGTWSTNFQAIGNVSATGNVISTGAVYSNYNTNTANTGSFMAQGGNTKGGTGYLDFLVVQNTSGGATNPYKWLRVNSTGGLEIINSAYTSTVFSLTDSGNVNVSGQYQVSGKQAVNGPAFRAYIDGSQTISSGSQQKVTFGSETFDTNANFASSRFTPTVEGYYQLNATVRISGSSGLGEVMLTIWKNGSEYARGTNEQGTEQGNNFYSMQVSDLAYANGSTDYFEIYIQQTSGGNRDTTAGTNISYFSGAMIRGA